MLHWFNHYIHNYCSVLRNSQYRPRCFFGAFRSTVQYTSLPCVLYSALQETLGLGVSYRSRGRRGMGGGGGFPGGGGLMGAQGWGILNIPFVSSPYVYPPPIGPPFLQFCGDGGRKNRRVRVTGGDYIPAVFNIQA
jgi:hypothetical protein